MEQILSTLLFCSLAAMGLTIAAYSQNPPPPKPNGNATVAPQGSLADLSPKERFVSTEGGFSIALPATVSSYSALTPANTGGSATGGTFIWKLREGIFIVAYHNYVSLDLKTDQEFADAFAGFRDSIIEQTKATVVSERELKLGDMRGHEYTLRSPSGRKGIGRFFGSGRRSYNMIALLASDVVPNADTLAAKAFDTFQLIGRVQE